MAKMTTLSFEGYDAAKSGAVFYPDNKYYAGVIAKACCISAASVVVWADHHKQNLAKIADEIGALSKRIDIIDAVRDNKPLA